MYLQAVERGYRVIGAYINNRTKIEMQCPDEHKFEIRPNSFKSGQGCARCADHCPIQAKENFYLEAIERGYQILGVYVNTRTKIKMQCPEEHLLEMRPRWF